MLLATYAAYSLNSPPGTTWSTAAGMTQRVNINNTALLSLSNDDKVQAAAGASGTFGSTATPSQTYALTAASRSGRATDRVMRKRARVVKAHASHCRRVGAALLEHQ
jgi:hypothetical protein